MIEGLDQVMLMAAGLILVGAGAVFLLVFIHGWVHRLDRMAFEAFTKRVRPRLLRAIQAQGEDRELLREMEAGAVRHRSRLLAQVGAMVRGEERERLMRVAVACGVSAHADRCTRSRRWWRRLSGVRVLVAVGGGKDSVPRLLADPHPLVRSEAARWCGRNPDPENQKRLLNLMDTPTLADRIAVIDALVEIGEPIVLQLARRLPSCSVEGRKAGLTAALGIADPEFVPVALALRSDGDPGVRLRVARLLSVLGGEESVEALEELLEDPVPQVRAAAARGLGRLGAWTAAGSLELLLADPLPEPRRDAALALGDLGPPGWILLRETARLGGPAGRLADAVLEAVWVPQEPGWTPVVKGVRP